MALPDGVQLFPAGNGGMLGICDLQTPGPPQDWVQLLPEPDRQYIASISHPANALRSAVARWLCQQVAQALGLPYQGIGRMPNGRPWLQGSLASVSLSHSGSFASVLINPKAPCGIDLEEIHEKAARLAPKFLSEQELNTYKPDAELGTLLWAIKEAVYKRLGLKGPTLRGHLEVMAIDFEACTALVQCTYPGTEPLLPTAFAKLPNAWLSWS